VGEIKKQSINNTVLSYVGALFGFLIIYIQPHLISSSDIGLVRLLYSFSFMIAVLMPLGMGSVTMRFFSKIRNEKNGDHGFFALLILITSIGAIITMGLLFLFQNQFKQFYQNSAGFSSYFNVMMVFMFILSMVYVLTIYSQSLFKTTITVFLTDIFIKAGQLGLSIIYHYNYLSRDGFVYGYVILSAVQLLILVFYLYKLGSVSFKINWSFFKSLDIKDISWYAGIMLFTGFASVSIKFVDQLMIGHFLDESFVGIYATCVMMSVIMEIPLNSLDRIAQPKIAHAWNSGNVQEVSKIYKMSSTYMFFIGSILFCMLWASLDFLFLFLPPEYAQGKMAFYIVSFSSLINLVTGVNTSVINMSHKYYTASTLLILLLVVSGIASYWLIPIFGIIGAAMATLMALGLFNLLKYVYILIRFKMQPFSMHTVYIFGALLVSISLILILPASLNPILKLIIGCSFTALLFAFINVKFNIIEEVNKLFKRFKLIK